jgi:hypothetical protein
VLSLLIKTTTAVLVDRPSEPNVTISIREDGTEAVVEVGAAAVEVDKATMVVATSAPAVGTLVD